MGTMIVVDQAQAGIHKPQVAMTREWRSHTRPAPKQKEIGAFEVGLFVDLADVKTNCLEFESKEIVFTQSDPAKSVLFIQEGGVKLSVADENGNEAVVGILGSGDFLGEACLAGQVVRDRTAVTIMPTKILSIDKSEMIRFLHSGNILFDRFLIHVLSRTIRVEEDLIDQILNTSEKRLARALLLLARNGKQGEPRKSVPRISQETLAEMVGTTRPRITHFMNKFRKRGFIKYESRCGELQINTSLLADVLQS